MRKLKTFLTLSLWMAVFISFAQPWTYDFGTGTGTANNANSGTGNTAFFTGTPAGGGTYRVRVGTGGGSIALNNPGTSLGTGSELQMTAATGTSTNKFSIYSWTGISSEAYLKTKIRTTSTGNGTLAIFMGTAPIGSTNNGYTGEYSGTLASCWLTYASGSISTVTRRNAGVNTAITGSGFQKDVDQVLEIYCNNSSVSKNYYRAGATYSLNAQSWDIWVDGTKVSATGGWAKASTIVQDVAIGAINFYAESSTGNAANMYLDDLEYSNALPPVPVPVITLSSPSQIAAANVAQGTQNHILSQFQASVSTASDVLSTINLTTTGTYSTTDVTNFNLYYNSSSNDFSGATSLASSGGSVVSGGTLSFSGLNTTIANGSTGYFFLTANFSGSASPNNTIGIAANPALLFAVATPSGAISAGGLQTIELSGTPDCAGVVGGSALPGSACDDNNACTINDVWSASCVCSGTVQDTDGDGTCDATDECDNDPNKILAGDCGCGNVEVGQSCNDNNACTENDVITSCGVCAGTALVDTDNDGTCDLTDECDNDPNKILAGTCGCGNAEPTSACDDGNALTSGDVINGSCSCVGLYPVVFYNFTGAAGSTPAVHTNSSITNLTPGTLTRGNNNGTTNATFGTTSASSGYTGASGTVNAGIAARAGALDLTAGSGSAYFEFSLDTDAGYSLTITELTFGTRSTSTGPQAIALRSSADGYVADLATTTFSNNSTWVLKSMLLSNYSTIPGSNITYRLYGYNGTGSPSTNTTNWRIDDLNIYGYTTFAPPSSIVQFSSPTQVGQEYHFSDTLTVTMDVAPLSDVTVAISDLLTGTATAGVDYNYTPTSVTFSPSDTYPSSKYVGFAIVNDTEVEPIETIAFGLSITSGTATLGTTTLTYSLTSDDLAQLVINEVDYDMNGTDNAEWIEIKNNGTSAVDINGYKLELVNGGNSPATVYSTITLATSSTLLQPGGYYVVGNNASIPNINLVVTPTTNLIQNGAPDAIGLKDNSNNLLDAVSYEGNTTSPYIEGIGVNTLVDAGSANFTAGTIGRFPDGADSGDNMVDWITLCLGTPGASNTQITSTFYQDFDADTFGNADSTIAACEAPFGYVVDNTDCNDTSAISYQGAVEICDDLDNNCDGQFDLNLHTTFYNDADGDGFGYFGSPLSACIAPAGYVTNFDDCEDNNALVYPGANFASASSYSIFVNETVNFGPFGNYYLGEPQYDKAVVQDTVSGVYVIYFLNTNGFWNYDGNCCYNSIAEANAAYPSSNFVPGLYSPAAGNAFTPTAPGTYTFQSYYGVEYGVCFSNVITITVSGIPGCVNSSACNYNPSATIDDGTCILPQTWYSDGDLDGWDFDTQVSCSSPGAAYTLSAGVNGIGDCNDALSTVYPGGTEVCGNGIDEDCLGGDLACPVGTFSTAIVISNIGQYGTGSQATQNVNLATGINTVQSPGLGLDKWFSFTATSNAMRIALTGNATMGDDNDLSLYETPTDATVQLIPIASENDVHPGNQGAAADGGNETLIYDQLIVGDVYYLCVRNNNNTPGNVSLTVSNLNPSTTDIALYTNGTNTFTNTCQNFKVKYRANSAGYTINRWASNDISGTPTWSYAIPVTSTVASTICQLGKVAPANLSGSNQTVYVTVDVLYNLTDAFGTVTPATARGNAAASFQLASEADLNVRTNDRCAAGFKSTASSIATNRSVCGTTRYVWEMTMVYPQASLPLEVQGPLGGSRVLMLNAVPAIANGQRYDVRVASKHVDGLTVTAYGSTQCVKTLGAAGMPTIEDEITVYERSENGITATIYPNPNNGQTVNFSITGFEGALNVRVSDATGRQVYSNLFMVEGAMNTTLEFAQTLANGIYMVELLQNGELKTMRMVVSK